jgi:MerR family transcriptional regulator/heat shock protein HspR
MVNESTPRSRLGVYGISVASELSGIDPQTLRLYEQRGLLTPARTGGGTRRYSDDDLATLQRIAELVDAGVNLAGVARILSLEADNRRLEVENSDLRAEREATSPRR